MKHILTVLIILLAAPVQAGPKVFTAGSLQFACENDFEYWRGACDGYIGAVGDMALSGGLYCPPSIISLDAGREVFLAYLRKHPDRAAGERHNVLLNAYVDRWPCPDLPKPALHEE